MSKIALSPPATGTATFTLSAPATNTDRTLTLPNTTAPILAGSGITLSASAPANTLVTDASGNVGIGTSSPTSRLMVNVTQTSSVADLLTLRDGTTGNTFNFQYFGDPTFGTSARFNWTGGYLAFRDGTTERARIDSSGNFLLSNTFQYYGTNQYTNKKYMQFEYPVTGFGAFSDCTNFYTPGNGSGLVQMRITQGGNVGCRGSFSGGQTLNDYAEYFEWSDGNPNNEDRIGVTVVLDGDKIRPSTDQDSGDDIVGVVSGTAGVVLGSSPFEWAGKYQKDEFGRIITEKVTWVHWSEGGTNHNYKVGKVPDGVAVPDNAEYRTNDNAVVVENYNESVEYQSRDQRKEWAPIGLVGQVHVKNGQLVGTRWRKMKDVSDNVALWLIR